MFEAMRPFLLDQVFEDADILGVQNLNRERLIQLVTENKAVEQEKLHRIGFFRDLKRGSKRT